MDKRKCHFWKETSRNISFLFCNNVWETAVSNLYVLDVGYIENSQVDSS